jgi:putative ABC transport system permease protein
MYFATFVLKNLTRRPVRTALTVLGLAVAVGSLVTLLGISHNVERAVTDSLVQRQVALVIQQAGKSGGLNSDFSDYFVDATAKIPGVSGVSAAVVDLIDRTNDSGSTDQVMIQGWRPDNFAFEDMKLVAGRKLEPGEHNKAMLGSTLAGNLGKAVGETVVLGSNNRFEIVGVFKSFVVFEDGGAILSLDDARKLTAKRVTGFSVRVDPNASNREALIENVRQQIEALRDPEDPTVRLSAQPPESYVNSLSHLKLIRAMTWMVAVVALVMGVVSMLNTMVMSVMERTQEIGILRAVGWPRGRVMRMILGESLGLGVVAAVVGILGAAAALYLLTLSPQVNGFVESGLAFSVALRGFVITAVIGLIGGTYPAFRAARLLPTEAIRHD